MIITKLTRKNENISPRHFFGQSHDKSLENFKTYLKNTFFGETGSTPPDTNTNALSRPGIMSLVEVASEAVK